MMVTSGVSPTTMRRRPSGDVEVSLVQEHVGHEPVQVMILPFALLRRAAIGAYASLIVAPLLSNLGHDNLARVDITIRTTAQNSDWCLRQLDGHPSSV